MRNWKLAVVCLATLPVQSFAGIPIVNLKAMSTAKMKSPAAYSLDELAADPLIVQSLNIGSDEKAILLQQIVDREQNPQVEDDGSEQSLIHNVQLFNYFGGPPVYNNRSYPQQNTTQNQALDEHGMPVARPMNCPIRTGPVKLKEPKFEPQIAFNQDDMSNPEDWKVKYFDMVIVINKNPEVQRMRVWRKLNRDNINEIPKLVVGSTTDERSGWKVSTGREIPEISNCDREAMNMPLSGHAPKESYFSQTPTGYYTPGWLHIDHVSGDWEDSAMDHAIFFDLNRGIATHKVPNGAEKMLGQKASGACVRMDQKNAATLFWMVRATGGPISQTEIQQKPTHCDKDYSNKVSDCDVSADGQIQPKGSKAYKACLRMGAAQLKTLCVQKNAARPKPNFLTESEAARRDGLAPYDDQPLIPYFSRDGKLMEDYVDEAGVKGLYWRRGVAKTLYIVENRFVEKKAEEPKVAQPKAAPKAKKAKVASAVSRPIVLRPVARPIR